jgi:hypothetical protein
VPVVGREQSRPFDWREAWLGKERIMKTRRAVSVGMIISFGFLLVGLVLLAQTEEQPARTETLRAALAQLEPVTSDALLQEARVFYMASDYLASEDENPPPYPCNVWPQANVFSLADGVFVVDDVGLSRKTLQLDAELEAALSTLEREYGLASAMSGDPSPPGDEADPDPGETNAPTITWPVSLSELTLV